MEWKTVKLGEVCKIFGRIGFRGYTNNDFVTKPEDGAITLSPTNIVDGELDLTKCAYINWNKYYESPEIMVQENDILLSKTGTIGRTALVKQVEHPMTINPQFVLLKECTINPRYLSYLLKTSKFQGDLYSITVGSVIATLSQKNLGNIKIHIVDSATQDKIVAILSSLDDKIENNNRINRNLEAQAQALFKSWFGEETNTVKLSEVSLNVTDGVHNTVIDDKDGEYLLLSCKNIVGGQLTINSNERRINQETFEKLRKRTKLAQGDILISTVGTVGEVVLLFDDPTNIEFQRSVGLVKPDKSKISSAYMYCALQFKQNALKHIAHGAVQQCIFIGDLKDFEIPYSSMEKTMQFDNIVSSIFYQISANIKENQRLAALRDTLLPKLMRGEIPL